MRRLRTVRAVLAAVVAGTLLVAVAVRTSGASRTAILAVTPLIVAGCVLAIAKSRRRIQAAERAIDEAVGAGRLTEDQAQPLKDGLRR